MQLHSLGAFFANLGLNQSHKPLKTKQEKKKQENTANVVLALRYCTFRQDGGPGNQKDSENMNNQGINRTEMLIHEKKKKEAIATAENM